MAYGVINVSNRQTLHNNRCNLIIAATLCQVGINNLILSS